MDYTKAIQIMEDLKSKQARYSNVDDVYEDLESIYKFIKETRNELCLHCGKYKQAINYFKKYYEQDDGWLTKDYPYKLNDLYKKNVDTLQQAIDNLELYKKALSNTIDIFNIDNPYEPMTVEGQLKGAREELENDLSRSNK